MNADKACLSAFICVNLRLRFDEAVVAVVAFVNHGETRGVGVAEDKELMRFSGQSQRGFFDCHWFNCIAARLDDARRARRGFEMPVRLWRHAAGGSSTLTPMDNFLLEFYRLLFNLGHGPR